ncbi:MAG: helix-turn-helix transcriptional regulator [Rhodobacteraceae bacterium]|nr:helix-turn-helix transcriptional regulator [Paracoccaceae bacterium]
MDPILSTIDEALKKKGLSDAAASKLAVGHPSLIKNFRIERAGEKRYNLPALGKLAEVLDLELYFGPRRDPETPPPEPFEIDGQEFSAIPRVAAEASAGPGAVNGDAEVIGSMAFRRDWLREHGIKPGKALLVTVTGDSMKPSIHPGDLVLLDQARTEIVNGAPFIFIDADGETRLKRLHRLGGRTLALVSDNPDHPPELRDGIDAERIKILGQIVWSGHSWG